MNWEGSIVSAGLFIALLITEYRRREAVDDADYYRALAQKRRRR
jgi:hypothetical protein